MKTYGSLEEAGIDPKGPKTLIGRGSYGKVWVYEGRPSIAVKSFKKSLTLEDDRLAKELDFYSFAHSHALSWVPLCLGRVVDSQTKRIHLLLERVGHDLRTYLLRAKPSEAIKREISLQMIGLVYTMAHHFGLCHLDLKTSNFLWDPKPKRLVLIDWGFVTLPSLRQGSIGCLGKDGSDDKKDGWDEMKDSSSPSWQPPSLTPTVQTEDYRAPEIFLAGSKWPRSEGQDLWSLGICLWEIWKGPLFPKSSSPEILRLLFRRFGPFTTVSNSGGPLAGWKGFVDSYNPEDHDFEEDGEAVFPGFMTWVRRTLLVTDPYARGSTQDLGAHPWLIERLKGWSPEIPLHPWTTPPPFDSLPIPFAFWTILQKWLWEVTLGKGLDITAFFLAGGALRHFLGRPSCPVTRKTLQGMGILSLFYGSLWCPPHKNMLLFQDLVNLCAGTYKEESLRQWFLDLTTNLSIPDLWHLSPWKAIVTEKPFEQMKEDQRLRLTTLAVHHLIHQPSFFEKDPRTIGSMIYSIVSLES